VEEPEDYVSDEEIQGDDIKDSTTPIPHETSLVITELVEVTSVTTEFTDVSHKNNTPISPKIIHVITEIAEVFHEDHPDKLSPTRDIQHIIDLILGTSLSDLPHHRMDPTMHIELKCQVDKLSLEVKQ